MTIATPNTSPDNLPEGPPSGAAKEFFTPEDLLRLPDAENHELVDGKLVERHMGAESSQIAMRIGILLGIFLRERRLSHIFGADVGYQCFPEDRNKVRRPDVSLIKMGRLAGEQVPKGYLQIAPDLAIEVVSPNDLLYEVDEKVDEYLSAGVALTWVVNPQQQTVHIYRQRSSPHGPVAVLRGGDTITGEDVLPGFSCPVEQFFHD